MKNEMNITISGSQHVHVQDISQVNNEGMQPFTLADSARLEEELDALAAHIDRRILSQEKNIALTNIKEAQAAVASKQPRAKVISILQGLGKWVADVAKEIGKTYLLSLINK